MDKAIWEYIKFVANAGDKNNATIVAEMAELHAISTGRKVLLDTFKEEYASHKRKKKQETDKTK